VVTPGERTSLDVVVNELFKAHPKKLHIEWLLGGKHALTCTGRIKKLTVTPVSGSSWHNSIYHQM
jgi:hypothetical protein